MTILAYNIPASAQGRSTNGPADCAPPEHPREDRNSSWADGVVIGRSVAIRAAIDLATRVGTSRAGTVLVCGETGTGKELFARGIHACSVHGHEPFVAVNCAAIPETLLESELFGHEKGAFTDARSLKRGLFEVAGCGAIFLDEVGELPLKLQPKLLRVLEQRTFRRLGGSVEIPIAARVIAGTNVSLADAVDNQTFREDLFYRLSVVRVDLPPLRARDGDVELLARHFLAQFTDVNGAAADAALTRDALAVIKAYAWPGNVRELRNAIERAVIGAGGDVIRPEHLLLQRRRDTPPSAADSGVVICIPPDGKTLDDIEREAIVATLSIASGNVSAAARILGISRPTLSRKLCQAGLTRRTLLVTA